MSKNITTIQNAKFCAFCKYWWDPACKYIAPYMGTQWCYETTAKCRCIKKSVDTAATSTCQGFKLKLDLS